MGKTDSVKHIFDETDKGSRRLLATALDGIDDRMVMFDAEDRLAFGNKSWWDEQAKFGLAPEIGDRYRDYAARLAASKFITWAEGREKEWVELRLEQRGNPGETIEVPLADGKVALVRDHRLPDGSTLTITTTVTTTVTERVAAEPAVAATA